MVRTCVRCQRHFNTVLEERVCHECWLDNVEREALNFALRNKPAKPAQKVKRKKPKRRRTRFERESVL